MEQRIHECAKNVMEGLGPFHSEHTYQRAMEIEFQQQHIRYELQPTLPIIYKECCVGFHRPDLIVDHQIIVELKVSKSEPTRSQLDMWEGQLRRYVTDAPTYSGLLIIFNAMLSDVSVVPIEKINLPMLHKKIKHNNNNECSTLVISAPESTPKFISFV
jgi:GxxExxY protein